MEHDIEGRAGAAPQGGTPPVSFDVCGPGRVDAVPSAGPEPPLSAGEGALGESPTWQVTMRGLPGGASPRVLATWTVRRWAAPTGEESPASSVAAPRSHHDPETCRPFGSSGHDVRVAASGPEHGWHAPPGGRPLGSSEWLARRSSRPSPPHAGLPEATAVAYDPPSARLGASERWHRDSAAGHALESRAASERPGAPVEPRAERWAHAHR